MSSRSISVLLSIGIGLLFVAVIAAIIFSKPPFTEYIMNLLSFHASIQPLTIIIISLLAIGLSVAAFAFYYGNSNTYKVNGVTKRGKNVSSGFVIVATLTAFFVPTLSLVTSEVEQVLTVDNFSNWNGSGIFVDINYPNPLTIPISNSIQKLSEPIRVDVSHPSNISINTIQLLSPLQGIISVDSNFVPLEVTSNKATFTTNITTLHFDEISNNTYLYKLRLNYINETSNSIKDAIIPFEWTIISKDLTWLGYFWIVLAGVVSSRFISFVVDTGESEALDIDRREAVWLVYTFIIAVLAFASFKDEITGFNSIMFSVIAAFVFGFGSDKVLELARAFPRTSETTASGPSQVQGLRVASPGIPGQLKLTWNHNPEPDIIGYNIYRDTTKGFTPDISKAYKYIVPSPFLDTGLTKNTPYFYVVAAVDSKYKVGPISSEISCTPT